jgi:hypothetical protein
MKELKTISVVAILVFLIINVGIFATPITAKKCCLMSKSQEQMEKCKKNVTPAQREKCKMNKSSSHNSEMKSKCRMKNESMQNSEIKKKGISAESNSYVCPMHPSETSHKMMNCSKCGMHLVEAK